MKGVLIQKLTKNLPGATKNLRQKPNSRRRKSLLTSEPSVGKQRLLSEFLSSGLVSTNEEEAGEDLSLRLVWTTATTAMPLMDYPAISKVFKYVVFMRI